MGYSYSALPHFTVGVLALSLLMSLPSVGVFLGLLAMTWGAGAVFLERRGDQSRMV